jgi:ATP-dependent RNA helicase MSS116
MRSSLLLRRVAQREALRRTHHVFQTPRFLTVQPPPNRQHFLSIRSFSSVPDLEENESEPQQGLRFEDLELHPKSLKAVRRHGLHNLTEIQEKTYDLVVSGKDVVGRARTGTGKTLSFLLPALERVVRQKELKPGIRILVMSPTRELAAQIAKDAERLTAQHGKEITSQVIYGGSSKREDVEIFNRQLPTILVATPGRLKDHLSSTSLRAGPFIDALQNLQTLVMDETDRLLDMGFRRDIQDILSCLPKRRRQTLLFSATLPKDVKEVVELAIKSDYELVDCIQEEDPASHTNAQTEQSHIVLPADRFWTGSMEYLLELMDKGDSKIMVFFPMTTMVQLYAKIFNMRFGRRVLELHGKMHQRERTTISGRFRNISKGLLFTSDVSARGVDYPNVTHVIQIGASESRETYIHRLGRTGRAGKRGKGLLILPELENEFLQDLEDLEIPLDDDLQTRLSATPSKKFSNQMGPLAQDVRAGREPKLERSVQDAYQAMIAYYFQRSHQRREKDVVSTVNSLVEDMGLRELPALSFNRARKIGIDSVSGLNIQKNWSDRGWTDGFVEKPPTDTRRPFGMPYGDFKGKFEGDERRKAQPERPNSWGGSDPHRSARGQQSRGESDSRPRARGPQGRGEPDSNRGGRGRQGRGESDSNRGGRGRQGRGESASNHGGRGRSGFQNERRGRWSEEPRGRQEGSRFNDAFAKLGWKSDDDAFKRFKPGPPKKKFQRWEAPGEFSFKK